MIELTQKLAKESFIYDSYRGSLIWEERPLSHFDSSRACNIFNSRFAGNLAGVVLNPKGSQCQYRCVNIFGKSYMAHRIVWLYHYGDWPRGCIDHINGNGLDNRIENLRDVDARENARNRPTPRNNKSGIAGVRVRGKGWNARISIGNKLKDLGAFKDFFSACCARKSAEVIYGFHENHGRPIINRDVNKAFEEWRTDLNW